MAQLIKLQDYISRYETDMYRYPSQFIRMKKDHYQKLLNQWQNEKDQIGIESTEIEQKKEPFLKRIFQKKDSIDVWDQDDDTDVDLPLPEKERELRQLFLDQVLTFQLKWASSTLQEVSYLDRFYEKDPALKYFLQRFPDSYFLLYHPIFKLKHAIIEGEIIIVTPMEILCIKSLEQKDGVKYKPIDQRKWLEVNNGVEQQVVSPLIDLKRTEKMVRSILDYHKVEIPIKKVVLSPKNYITDKNSQYNIDLIDQENYESWFNHHRQTKYPIKFQQLKVSEALLNHTQKTYVKRPIWEEDEMM